MKGSRKTVKRPMSLRWLPIRRIKVVAMSAIDECAVLAAQRLGTHRDLLLAAG